MSDNDSLVFLPNVARIRSVLMTDNFRLDALKKEALKSRWVRILVLQ